MKFVPYDIHLKFVELYRKYMDIPEGVSKDEIDNQIHHNLEYSEWCILPNGSVLFSRESYSLGTPPEPLGLFYGQDENMRKVEQGFRNFVEDLQGHARLRIHRAMTELHEMRIEVGHVQVPRVWSLVLPSYFLGIKVKRGDPPRVFSTGQYGRFVEFDL